MPLFKTQGWVIRRFPFGESSLFVVTFTRGKGKIRVMAKGSRRPNSKVRAGLELFTVTDFVLFEREGREFYYVREAHPILQLKGFREDLRKLKVASLFAGLIEKALPEGVSFPNLYLDVMDILPLFERLEEKRAETLFLAFSLRLLRTVGNRPVLDRCVKCGSEENLDLFSPEEGGLVCRNCCGNVKVFPVSGSARKLLSALERWPLRETVKLVAEGGEAKEILGAFVESHLGIELPYFLKGQGHEDP